MHSFYMCTNCNYVEETLFDDDSMECSNCGAEMKLYNFYTSADLDKAIADEREECAQECLMLDGARLDDSFTDALEMCAEAIRNRGQNDNSN